METTSTMSAEQAMFEVSVLDAEANGVSFEDFAVSAIERGVPVEVITRLRELWNQTKEIGGELIHIGKVIVIRIIEFLKAHPKLTASLAIGAVVYLLSSAVPLIGPWLAPILAALATAGVLLSSASLEEAIAMAKGFFQLLIDIFNTLAERWSMSS
jgi:hypothetical protein